MTDDDELGARIEAAINDAIEAVVREHEHGFVVKWVGVVETFNDEGTRGVWTMTSPAATAWDTLGLLGYASARETAAIATADEEED